MSMQTAPARTSRWTVLKCVVLGCWALGGVAASVGTGGAGTDGGSGA